MVVKLDLVWQILIHLLNERGDASDKAVQITTALAIKECVDVSDECCTRDRKHLMISYGMWTSATSFHTFNQSQKDCG